MRLPALATICALLPAIATAQAQTFRVVELSGTPYERGVQHGTQLRGEIAAMTKAWAADLEADMAMPLDRFVARFLAATQFDRAAHKHTPELLDEVRGIAAGSAQPYETMLVYQLIDEMWAQCDLAKGDLAKGDLAKDPSASPAKPADPAGREKCSTIGVDRDGDTPGFVAQNIDIPQWMHAHPTLLRIRHGDSDLQSLVVTLPGLVGANGINNHRVAVCVNTILQLAPRPDGLPVAFVVRGLLAQPDHAAALAFLQRVPHASGQAYTIGGPDSSPCFEASAHGVAAWQPPGRSGWTWHTNHPLVNREWSQPILNAAAKRGVDPEKLLRCERFAALDRALPADRRPTVEQAVEALKICEGKAQVCNAGTYCCTVMVLGAKPELRLTAGRPDQVPFRVFAFD